MASFTVPCYHIIRLMFGFYAHFLFCLAFCLLTFFLRRENLYNWHVYIYICVYRGRRYSTANVKKKYVLYNK